MQKLFRTKKGDKTIQYSELKHGQCAWVDGPDGREIRMRFKQDSIDQLVSRGDFMALKRSTARVRAEANHKEYLRQKSLRTAKFSDRYSMHALQ